MTLWFNGAYWSKLQPSVVIGQHQGGTQDIQGCVQTAQLICYFLFSSVGIRTLIHTADLDLVYHIYWSKIISTYSVVDMIFYVAVVSDETVAAFFKKKKTCSPLWSPRRQLLFYIVLQRPKTHGTFGQDSKNYII